MSRPKRGQYGKLRPHSLQANDVAKLLDALRTLDRTVVEISMHMYRIPHHDRLAMREQHRRLHDTIRERLPRFLSKPATMARS
jgi:hypothetical protein